MRLTFFFRKPSETGHSIENIFLNLEKKLPEDIKWTNHKNKYESSSIIYCLYNTINAFFHRSDINHVTGDAHYVTYLLPPKQTVLSIMDCVLLKTYRGLKKFIIFFFWYWLPEKRCKYITTISESTKKQLLNYLKCNSRKIRVIYCPLLENFIYTPKSYNKNKPVILHVGTGDNKNLLRVSESLVDFNCHLRIIGPLKQEQIMRLQNNKIEYSSISNITLDQMIKEYIGSDIVLFVSTYEGFGMPIIEAQAIGRPVITSNIYSMPEVAGIGACLVDPYNISAIRSAVMKIHDEHEYRNKLIKDGLENIKRFDAEKILKQYLKLYYLISNKTLVA